MPVYNEAATVAPSDRAGARSSTSPTSRSSSSSSRATRPTAAARSSKSYADTPGVTVVLQDEAARQGQRGARGTSRTRRGDDHPDPGRRPRVHRRRLPGAARADHRRPRRLHARMPPRAAASRCGSWPTRGSTRHDRQRGSLGVHCAMFNVTYGTRAPRPVHDVQGVPVASASTAWSSCRTASTSTGSSWPSSCASGTRPLEIPITYNARGVRGGQEGAVLPGPADVGVGVHPLPVQPAPKRRPSRPPSDASSPPAAPVSDGGADPGAAGTPAVVTADSPGTGYVAICP